MAGSVPFQDNWRCWVNKEALTLYSRNTDGTPPTSVAVPAARSRKTNREVLLLLNIQYTTPNQTFIIADTDGSATGRLAKKPKIEDWVTDEDGDTWYLKSVTNPHPYRYVCVGIREVKNAS